MQSNLFEKTLSKLYEAGHLMKWSLKELNLEWILHLIVHVSEWINHKLKKKMWYPQNGSTVKPLFGKATHVLERYIYCELPILSHIQYNKGGCSKFRHRCVLTTPCSENLFFDNPISPKTLWFRAMFSLSIHVGLRPNRVRVRVMISIGKIHLGCQDIGVWK